MDGILPPSDRRAGSWVAHDLDNLAVRVLARYGLALPEFVAAVIVVAWVLAVGPPQRSTGSGHRVAGGNADLR